MLLFARAGDRPSDEEYSCDNGKDRTIAQTALGPTMHGIAEADAEKNAKNEPQACGASG